MATQKKHPLLDKVKEFLHRLSTKISLTFKGKYAVFTIQVDLTQNVMGQLKGIDYTLLSQIPVPNELQDYLDSLNTKSEA